MAEVLAKKVVLPPWGRRSSALSCERRRPSSVVALSSVFEISRPSSKRSSLYGKRFVLNLRRAKSSSGTLALIPVQMSLSVWKPMKWWTKGLQPNMKEIESAHDLVDSLLNAGDKLVIVDFFSPGCAGCKALHPKICQIAEMNPDVLFLQVNHEKHKSMCYSLNIHVLPFFRFYRGAQGRLCSFSCTNATIKKFKDALAKHKTDRCSLGPTRGLEEKELLALAANKDLSFSCIRRPTPLPSPEEVAEEAPAKPMLPLYEAPMVARESEDKALAAAGSCWQIKWCSIESHLWLCSNYPTCTYSLSTLMTFCRSHTCMFYMSMGAGLYY